MGRMGAGVNVELIQKETLNRNSRIMKLECRIFFAFLEPLPYGPKKTFGLGIN